MTVKPVDPERFPTRAAAARATQAAVIRAAAELFVQHGYAGTTMQQVAERAGVGRATVFTSVRGGKPALLRLARDRALAGDDELVPIPQRSWFIETMAEPDGERLLRRQAGNYRQMLQRAAALELELQSAAKAHSELQTLAADARRQRALGARLVVQHVSAKPPGLRAHLTERRAADTLYALTSAGLWQVYSEDCGWSPEEYQHWLADQLVAELIGPARPTR